MKSRVLVSLILPALLTFGAFDASAATIAGTSCTKVGNTKIVSGVKYFCVKSGKKLIWNKGTVVKASATPTTTKSASTTASSTPSASQQSSTIQLTADEVAKHVTSDSCWSIVFGNVYDLTKWIPKHPGGATVIRALCGKDGTSAFEGQHANQGKPARELSAYYIGKLGDSIKG